MPDGASVALAASDAVLGRNPAAPASAPHAQVVPIADATRTVSKTHALLRRTGEGDSEAWVITDLGSTNGVTIVDVSGAESPGLADTPVADRFFLGDAEFSLTREA